MTFMGRIKPGIRRCSVKCSPVPAPCFIERLPNELTLHIIELCLPPRRLFTPHSCFPCVNANELNNNRLGALTLVCKRWYTLIVNCTSFWTTLLEAYNVEKLDDLLITHLKRAQDRPISVVFFGPYASPSAWRILLHEAPRIEEVYQGTSCVQDVKNSKVTMPRSFPLLKRLHVTFDGCEGELSFFQPQISLPALDTLSLTYWPLRTPIPHTLWSQLKHLSLQHSPHALTYEGFTCVAQNLLSLRLKNAYLRTDSLLPPVEFPKLHTLELDMSGPVCGFSRFDCPALEHLILAGTNPIDISDKVPIAHGGVTRLTLRDTLIIGSYASLLRRFINLRTLEVINPVMKHPSNRDWTAKIDVEGFLTELIVSPFSFPTCPALSEIQFTDKSQVDAMERLHILADVIKSRGALLGEPLIVDQLQAARIRVMLPKGITADDGHLLFLLYQLSQLRKRSISDLVLEVKWFPPQSIPERLWRSCVRATMKISIEALEDCFCLSCRTLRKRRIKRLDRKPIVLQPASPDFFRHFLH